MMELCLALGTELRQHYIAYNYMWQAESECSYCLLDSNFMNTLH